MRALERRRANDRCTVSDGVEEARMPPGAMERSTGGGASVAWVPKELPLGIWDCRGGGLVYEDFGKGDPPPPLPPLRSIYVLTSSVTF